LRKKGLKKRSGKKRRRQRTGAAEPKIGTRGKKPTTLEREEGTHVLSSEHRTRGKPGDHKSIPANFQIERQGKGNEGPDLPQRFNLYRVFNDGGGEKDLSWDIIQRRKEYRERPGCDGRAEASPTWERTHPEREPSLQTKKKKRREKGRSRRGKELPLDQ